MLMCLDLHCEICKLPVFRNRKVFGKRNLLKCIVKVLYNMFYPLHYIYVSQKVTKQIRTITYFKVANCSNKNVNFCNVILQKKYIGYLQPVIKFVLNVLRPTHANRPK